MPWQNAASQPHLFGAFLLSLIMFGAFLLSLIMKKGKIKKVDYFIFNCPGCGHEHTVPIEGTGNDWTMTGTEENPTLEPSVLNYNFKNLPDGKQEKSNICHLFIRNGKIEYCSDSQHALGGQTVDMLNFQ